MRYIGFHLSIAGGAYKAFKDCEDLGINTFQIFLKSSNRWTDKPYKEDDITRFKAEFSKNPNIKIFAHSAYLINPAADDAEVIDKSLLALTDELVRADQLGVPWIVLHPGSHKGTGVESGIERAVTLIDTAFKESGTKTGILLETTAGQGNAVGHRFEHLSKMKESSRYGDRIGICLDTCHVFSAGYDFTSGDGMKSMIQEIEETVGVESLKLIHLNDSKFVAGSLKDRHEHIGKGNIGESGISMIVNEHKFKDIPLILETPKEGDDKMQSDRENLEAVRNLLGDKNV